MSDLLQGDNNQNTEANTAQGEQAPQQQQTEQQPEQQEQQTFLSYGERKFSSPDEVVKKLEHADRYIEEKKQREAELEQEVEKLRAELAKSKKIEDAMQELKSTRQDTQSGGNTSQPSQSVDPEKLKQEVLQALKQEQAQATVEAQRKANLSKAHEAAVQKYGTSYMDTLVKNAKERGLDLEQKDIIDLAASKPGTFSVLFDLKNEPKKDLSPKPGQRVSATPNPSQQGKARASWKDVARETAEKLGVENYDSSFHRNTR